MRSSKYPNWEIKKQEVSYSDENCWLMIHDDNKVYGVLVWEIHCPETDYRAEILTRQTCPRGSGSSYEPARKQFTGTVTKVVTEVERRIEYWKNN